MIRYIFTLFFLIIILQFNISAQTPTWSEDIAEIIYQNCSTCHRSGNIAPFILESYAAAVSNISGIAYEVNNGTMPPWLADPTYVRHANERILTPDQITKINDWIAASMPIGDIAVAPPFPSFTDGSTLSGVDLSLKIPDYTSTAITDDEYRCFVIPSGVTVDKFINEMEILPGNRDIVHHVLIFTDTTGEAATLDAVSPGAGYPCFGDDGTSNPYMIGAWVPGGDNMVLPDGFGIRLAANSDIILQIHYPAGSSGILDSSRINMKFDDATTSREVYSQFVLNHFFTISEPLIIPANTEKDFTSEYEIPNLFPGFAITLFAVGPHMHLVGESIKTYAINTSGDTIPLNNIPDWDFHWQGTYYYPNPKIIMGGSTLKAEAHYNNTITNTNLTAPPSLVVLGESTSDEMFLVNMLFSIYNTGDEDIVMDSIIPDIGVGISAPIYSDLSIYPNPSANAIYINLPDQFSLYVFTIYDMQGKIVYTNNHINTNTGYVPLPELSNGLYTIALRNDKKILQNKLIVAK